jgi:putative phosphoesterase
MRVAAVSDIHGNLPALEAVLADVEREDPELVVFCGDVASGPMPAETIERLMTVARARFVLGNADQGLIDQFDGRPKAPMSGPFAEWCAARLDRTQRNFLASFEDTVTVDDVEGIGRVLFCHATPRNNTDVFTSETPAARVASLLAGADADLIVCGHTHIQFDRTVDRRRIVNAGSAGMPYGEPGAYWAMLGPGVDLRRTEFDREAAANRIRAVDWELAARFASENVLTVPSKAEAMDFMRKFDTEEAG